MKTKHTPGPWTLAESKLPIRGNCERLRIDVSGPHRMPIAELYGTESRTNARLIAAAPELLEACQLALQILEDDGRHGQTDDMQSIQNAIAKATGGE